MDKISEDFKTNVKEFLGELINLLPNEGNIVLVYIYINTKVSKEELINTFIEKCLPLKEHIDTRDDLFFLNLKVDSSLDALTVGYVDYFKELWKSDKLDQEDRNVIWQWLDLFIKLADKYKST